MKLTHDLALRQQTRQTLSQDLRRALGVMALDNLGLAETLRAAAADNPCLRLRLPAAAGGEIGDGSETAAEGPSLIAHVLARLPDLVPAAADRPLALALVEELDSAGFLARPLPEIARRRGDSPERAGRVLRQLQRIEPRGLFARSLAECLALQLPEAEARAPDMARLLAALPALTQGGPAALARETALSEPDIARLLARLRQLDPRPAAAFAQAPARLRIADLIFTEAGGDWQVALNPDTLPRATLADMAGALPRFRREAQSLIQALQRRNDSLLALGRILIRDQAGFLARGAIAQRPLTLRAVAAELGLHESTLGRMVGAGAAATPAGTLPLRRFFCRATGDRDGEQSVSAPAVTAKIAKILATEPDHAPLSDAQIAAELAAQGLSVSRRVTAKLRARAGFANRAARRRRA
ncbi:MAG: hypothetical protein AB7S99_00090 [Pseudodonghicola sp.]